MTEDITPTLMALTPSMIAAGVHVLAEQHGVVSEYVAEEIAEDVFRAMMSAAGLAVSSPSNGNDSDGRPA